MSDSRIARAIEHKLVDKRVSATLDAIRAEIEEYRDHQKRGADRTPDGTDAHLTYAHGATVLSAALAIIDRHMKEKA